MTDTEIQEVAARVKPGARRKKAKLKQTPVMLTEGDRQALDIVADELGRSRSALIREAVQKVWLKGRRPSTSTRD